MLVDTHAHLYWEDYKQDFEEVVKRSLNVGVITIINVGVDVDLSKKAVQLESSKVNFYSTIGIHPHEVLKYPNDVSIQQDIEKLEEIYQSSSVKVVAVGECGLDYLIQDNNYNDYKSHKYYKKKQRMLFQAQIDLAKKLSLPLIVHCRDDRSKDPQNSEAWDKVLEMIGSHPTILHCYSGLLPTTNQVLITNNLLVSFAATITYPKNEYLKEAAKILPLEKIVLETDCPFLPPQSKRGQKNEPANIVEIAQTVAEIKGISFEEIANQTTENAKKIFGI